MNPVITQTAISKPVLPTFLPAHTRGTAFGFASSDTFVAVQAGLGLDMTLKPHLAGRLELDVRRLRTGRECRAIAGLVYVR